MKNYTNGDNSGFAAAARSSKHPGKSWILPFLFKTSLILGLIFTTVAVRIHFNQKTDQLNKQMVSIRARIYRLDLEMNNLRNRKEKLSSYPYINARIKQFHLALRPAEPSQVKRLKLLALPSGRRLAPPVIASARDNSRSPERRPVGDLSMR